MVDLHGFDARTVEPAADLTPIPPGKYLAIITESEMKPTKSGVGSYLELTFQIIEGEYKNRNLWARLNLDNPTPLTVKIAQGELSAICRAVNVLAPKDSLELHNLPLTISVKTKKRQDTGEIVNEIKGYAKRETLAAKPQQNTGQAPWARR